VINGRAAEIAAYSALLVSRSESEALGVGPSAKRHAKRIHLSENNEVAVL